MIRLARADDAAAILAIYAPIVRDTTISFELDVPDEHEIRRRVLATLEHAPWLVLEDQGEIRGYAYASRFRPRAAYDWTVEVTVYVHAAHRHRGVGRALYATLFDLLRVQGFHLALAGIALPNAESVALHEKMGFERVGVFTEVGHKLGAWRDTGWWQLVLGPGSVPNHPRTPRECEREPAWRAALGAQT